MADIYQIRAETRVALKTLRTLEKAGYLVVDKSKDPMRDTILRSLTKQNPLSVPQLLHLYRNPALVDKLDLEEVVDRLGNVDADAAPWTPIGIKIDVAASRNADAIAAIATWLRDLLETLPAGKEVGYSWIAVRLLANVPDNHLALMLLKLRPCMWNVRASDILAGYSRIAENRSAKYFRKIELDL